MRFLCLHGMGTNSKIFEIQMAKILHSLSPGHEFIFVDGNIPWDPAPGIKDIFPEYNQFFRYIDEEDVNTFQQFYHEIAMFIRSDGPFDGLFAFSEGGGIAASMLAQQLTSAHTHFTFKCAVLFCAGGAISIEALKEGKLRRLDPGRDGKVLTIPIAHIWDPEDTVHPGFGSVIRHLSGDDMAEEVQHNLGHEIPGRGDLNTVAETVKAIERTIERAETEM